MLPLTRVIARGNLFFSNFAHASKKKSQTRLRCMEKFLHSQTTRSSILIASNVNYKLNAFAYRSMSTWSKDSDEGLAWKKDKKIYDQGPDQIIPSKAMYTWTVDGAVQLRSIIKPEQVPFQYSPKSIPGYFKQLVNESPDFKPLAKKVGEEWKMWTMEQYYMEIQTVAKAFIALGLERYHTVCVLANNSPEWFISYFAAIFAGGFGNGVYLTSHSARVVHYGQHSRANIFVVDDDQQLAKIVKIRDRLPELKVIIKIENESTPFSRDAGVVHWNQLVKLGQEQLDSKLDERLRQIALNQCCSLVYTSGTTGKPKGVMLSHDNFCWGLQAVVESNYANELKGPQRLLSFLPLSHIAGQLAEMYLPLHLKATVYFGDKNLLQGSLMSTLKEVKPTIFLGVPRIFEKMENAIREVESKHGPLKQFVVDLAKQRSLKYHEQLLSGVQDPKVFGFKMFDKLIFKQVKEQLGLDDSQCIFSGGAPTAISTIKFFMSFNILISQMYGLSETTGSHTFQNTSNFKLGSNGKAIHGHGIRIVNPNEHGVGEIALNGRNIMMGYLGDETRTKNTFTPDNWLLTGDLGYLTHDEFFFVAGRQKDIMITAGGENVSPVEIEEKLKVSLPIISQVAAIGDKKKCVTVLLTLKTETNTQNEPTDTLTPFVQDWIAQYSQLQAKTIADVLPAVALNSNHKLRQVIENMIQASNGQTAAHAHHVNNWVILPHDFSISGGEFGPTLKLKRQYVSDKYKSYIDDMYANLDQRGS